MKLYSITLKPASRYDNSIQFRYYFYSKSENTVCLVYFNSTLDCLLSAYKPDKNNYHYNNLNAHRAPAAVPNSILYKYTPMAASLYWLAVDE